MSKFKENKIIIMVDKNCTKCKILKPLDDYYFRSDKPHLKMSSCKKCVALKTDENNKKDIQKKLSRDRNYHYRNRAIRIAYLKEYNKKNRVRKSAHLKIRYHSDIFFKVSTNLRNRIRIALKRNSKSDSTAALIGCSLRFLKLYLSSLFVPGMNWENYGEWQIDHKKPCSSFDLSNPSEQCKCFHYTNLQPLWKEENRIKSNKMHWEREVCHR